MKSFILKNLSLLERSEKIEFVQIFCLMILVSLIEVVGILSIMPFMAVLSDPGIISTNKYLNYFYEYFNFKDHAEYLFSLGLTILVIIIFGNCTKALMTWRSLRFCYMQNFRLSKRLFELYLKKPYFYFLQTNSADISSNILTEVSHYVNGILMMVLRLFSSILTTIFIVAMLMVLNPTVVVGTVIIMAAAYYLVYILVKDRLETVGEQRYSHSMRRYKLINEALHGIKQVKLHGKEGGYVNAYATAAVHYSRALTLQGVVSQMPRFFMETVAFGLVIGLAVYLLAVNNSVASLLPFMAVYVFAGYRLIPALQQIFASTTSIRFHRSTLESYYQILKENEHITTKENICHKDVEALPLRKTLKLENASFCYEGAPDNLVDNLNLEIQNGATIGFVGATGSGKTTIIDMLIGLLPLKTGSLTIDGMKIDYTNLPCWQKTIGYVSQSIYLIDANVIENIAFGIPAEEIDLNRVKEVAVQAQIDQFIKSELPDQYETMLGENGIRLSGGQKQRIGLARSLYTNPSVLILDEATSALDGETERKVLNSIQKLSPNKTIIMIAHRLNTLRDCDCIYIIDKGDITGIGSYDELIKNNESFKILAGNHHAY